MASASDAVPVGTLPPVGEIPTRMFAQLVRQDRFGDPRTAFQVEEVDTPAPGPGEVLIAVMASGNQLQQRVCSAGDAGRRDRAATARRRPERLPSRRQRRVGNRLRRRRGCRACRSRRRGHRPPRLVEERRPVGRGGQGSDDRPLGPHLGLRPRSQLRLVRAVRGRAGASGAAEGRPPHVGGSRRVDARRHDRTADALRLGGQHRPEGRHRPRLGRLGRPRQPGDPARQAGRRDSGGRRLERGQG